GTGASIIVEATRLQPPTAFWAVYRAGRRWVTLRCSFAADDAEARLAALVEAHPDRLGDPAHPRGGLLALPELNGVLWSPQFDPSLAGLGRCLDGEWVGQIVGSDAAVVSELVAYDPEQEARVVYCARTGEAVAHGTVSVNGTGGVA